MPLRAVIRPLVGVLQASAQVDDTERAALGITVPDTKPTPVDSNELIFLATDTRTPYVANFDGADGNKVAHYMLRWESTRGEIGPWSETASATIGA